MAQVTDLWRHPIKGVGCERLETVSLATAQCMPMDRHWAIAHADAKLDYETPEWARCINFARGARGAKLMAVGAKFDAATRMVHLTHPDLEDLCVNPDDPADASLLVDWVTRISDPRRSLPAQVYKAPNRGMTDSGTASLSIHTRASMDALASACGASLDQRRFRGNIWLDGAHAWEEFDWIGKRLRVGTAEFEITKPVERCVATMVNPDTGITDRETLKALKDTWGHQDFGVFAIVTKAGDISLGDEYEVL
ncbi:MAG: hypothetical protein COB84_06520 [Rhodobacteraceae bacterium]|nr:MAG: hypothetical protein COB84_06520 [Paracoccaceae bacterium]